MTHWHNDVIQRMLAEDLAAGTLGDNDSKFLSRVFASGLGVYRERLENLGFAGLGRVLDLGCGFGQWSLALSQLNREVVSVDTSSNRLDFLRRSSNRLGIKNIETICAGAETPRLWGGSFDAVFAYGVLFLTPWKETLASIYGSLTRGGKLYFTANDIGWYLYLWQTNHNKANDYNPREVVSRVFADTLLYEEGNTFRPGSNVIIEVENVLIELERCGFQLDHLGAEGSFLSSQASKNNGSISFFPGKYKGLTSVYEVQALKR